ncbi:MAG: rRNA pseudouridine synthase [Candidatus Omnitrophica bacterium]|nr:rRNA pseudouridine synthase [Candidatus Omnitrophota bacterium]
MKRSASDKNSVRLQVFLSHNGVSSRRKAMDIVKSGRVAVNGTAVTEPSTPVRPGRDKITLDGHTVSSKGMEYILLNKSAGYATTKEVRLDEDNVFRLLPRKFHHLSPVGRLDKNTEGLLLLTNDGDTAYRLTHPKFRVEKTYIVQVEGEIKPPKIKRLINGVIIDDRKTARARVFRVRRGKESSEFFMTIHEGRKRQIRRMCEKVGHKVLNLKRIAQGPLQLGNLASGQWRPLTRTEVQLITRSD